MSMVVALPRYHGRLHRHARVHGLCMRCDGSAAEASGPAALRLYCTVRARAVTV
jgi:hypothetical protein